MTKEYASQRGPRPQFRQHYDLGWIGFVHGPSRLSRAITYLTRRDRVGDIIVNHALVVTGPDECVEANMPVGVVVNRLSEAYFDREDEGEVIFRKPKGLTAEIAERVAARAKSEVGARFDITGMVAEGLGGTFLGHFLNSLFDNKPRELMAKLLHEKGQWVCSDLAMYCLREQPEFRGKGVLTRPVGTVSPQALFEDEEVFDPLPHPDSTDS
jgi:hypothetical protein